MKKVNKVLEQVVKGLMLVSMVTFSLIGCGGSDMSSEAMISSNMEASTYEEESYSDTGKTTSEMAEAK